MSAYRSHGYGKLNARPRGSRERALQQERVLVFTAEPAWEYDTAGTAGARHLVNTHIEILSADRGNDFDTRKHLYDTFFLMALLARSLVRKTFLMSMTLFT